MLRIKKIHCGYKNWEYFENLCLKTSGMHANEKWKIFVKIFLEDICPVK